MVDKNLVQSSGKILHTAATRQWLIELVSEEEAHFIFQVFIDWFVRFNISLGSILNSNPAQLQMEVLII